MAIYNNGGTTLQSINLYGNGLLGYINKVNNNRFYYVKDHLGSIRQTIHKTGEYDPNDKIVSSKNYYPYGSIIKAFNYSATDRYDFTEKEHDKETNFHYFGARYFDSDIGRWTTVDPLASKYPGWSPYNYTLCNPINNYDTDGKAVLSGATLAGGAIYVAGAGAIAFTVHTIKYTTDARYRRSYNSFTNSAMQVTSDAFSGAVENVSDFIGSLFSEGENTNPWVGPVDSGVNVVDADGNVISVKAGEQVAGNEDGSMIQVKDKDGKPTGTRKDGKGHPKQKDPKAQRPHGHRIDENGNPILDETGNPHLPINGG